MQTNLQELAIVAMALALKNATSNVTTIKKTSSSRAFDPFSNRLLGIVWRRRHPIAG